MRSTRVRTPVRPFFVVDLAVAMALLSLACQTSLRLGSDGRLEDVEDGYSIADLAALDPAWHRIGLEHAELAYSDGHGGSMTMLRECRGGAQPALLARQLRIGNERVDEPVLEAHPVALHGDPGWQQTFVVVEGSDELLVRSVTISAGRCTYDWVLVGAGDVERDAAFERWWLSFLRADSPDDASASGEES